MPDEPAGDGFLGDMTDEQIGRALDWFETSPAVRAFLQLLDERDVDTKDDDG